uniref:Uncharacterized protein n=1 Tax=Plectus sambesii TaxID=2011161 RepID=A0A914UVH1_9BILA
MVMKSPCKSPSFSLTSSTLSNSESSPSTFSSTSWETNEPEGPLITDFQNVYRPMTPKLARQHEKRIEREWALRCRHSPHRSVSLNTWVDAAWAPLWSLHENRTRARVSDGGKTSWSGGRLYRPHNQPTNAVLPLARHDDECSKPVHSFSLSFPPPLLSFDCVRAVCCVRLGVPPRASSSRRFTSSINVLARRRRYRSRLKRLHED